MAIALRELVDVALAPPRFIALPFAGVDISTSGVKVVRLVERPHGLELAAHAQVLFPAGAFADGEITDHAAANKAFVEALALVGVDRANVSLSESKSYLFETEAAGTHASEWRTAVEQQLDELVPLPPVETAFDIVPVGAAESGTTRVAGIGFARRIVDDTLSVCDEAGLTTTALESETFAMARALLPRGDESTTLIIDVGKTTTKLAVVESCVPRFATTIGIGGHALTLAVQKHFGVTETEARRVKAERGIVPAPGNEDYLAAMLSTVSAIRDEIARHLEYWQGRAALGGVHRPVTQAILAGGNASLRGLPEYLEGSLHIPVTAGDVFRNLAPRAYWLPDLEYSESLAYATAIGLALRDAAHPYA